jgi:hypothetical protein
MPKIFISYRREDSIDIAGRIYDRLSTHFGRDSVFFDVDTIPLGIDFRNYLEDWIGRSDLVLVIIGPRWLDSRAGGDAGTTGRRLDNPADFVRIEVASALARGIPVIPVLVGGATMPGPARLPDSLADLAFRHAIEVNSGRDFHMHMDRMIRGLDQMPMPAPRRDPPTIVVPPPAVVAPMNLGFEGPNNGGMPEGWFNSLGFVDRVSTAYEVRVEPRPDGGPGRCVRMRREGGGHKEFGSLMQRCPARHLGGVTVRLEAELRTEALESWAGLWLRLDGPGSGLFFDNMHDRPIRGSTPWTRYAIETRVPEGAEWINYGFLLVANGTVWADHFRIALRGPGGDWVAWEGPGR